MGATGDKKIKTSPWIEMSHSILQKPIRALSLTNYQLNRLGSILLEFLQNTITNLKEPVLSLHKANHLVYLHCTGTK